MTHLVSVSHLPRHPPSRLWKYTTGLEGGGPDTPSDLVPAQQVGSMGQAGAPWTVRTVGFGAAVLG